MPRPLHMICVCSIALLAWGAAAWAEADPRAALERAVEAHPKDPDLALALARAQLDAGAPERAVAVLEPHIEPSAEARPQLLAELGRALQAAGRPEEALAILQRATRARPEDGAAQLTLGLTLRDLGRHDEAETAIEHAVVLAPELASEAFFLLGLESIRAGRRDAAERQLKRAVDVRPEGDAARAAAPLLRRLAETDPAPRPVQLALWSGFEMDSNVTLESDNDVGSVATDRRDRRWVFGGRVVAHPWRGERTRLAVGYRFDQTEHDELSSFDLQTHTLFASASWFPAERVALRLDGSFQASELDHHRYMRARLARPNLFLALPGRIGLLRLYLEGEERSYKGTPILPSLERDALVYGGGFEHSFILPWVQGARLSFGLNFARTDTEGGRDLFGLADAFEHDRTELRLSSRLPLPFGLRLDGSLRGGYERYAHRNLIDLFTDDGVGNPDPRKRRDTVIESRMALARGVTRFADLELEWRQLHRTSNVDAYDYDRRVVGLYVRMHLE